MSPEPDAAVMDALAGLGVSRETQGLLRTYVDQLSHWQRTTNLVAPSTLREIWTRHILDSAQLLEFASPGQTWLDLGSGGGLPGLVLACQFKPMGGAIHLVESNAKKAAFLRHVTTVLAVPARIHLSRIEQALPGMPPPDVVTARALAPLTQLIGYTKELLKSGTVGLFPKGKDHKAELTEARKDWHFSYELHASRTDPEARIIRVSSLT